MDWNDLRYFYAIARARTLVGAARELKVEHSTVSRRLAALEQGLGVRLFLRGPSGFTLTAAGESVLSCVAVMAAQVEAIERRVTGGDTRVEGTVRLTIPESMNEYIVQPLMQLRERHPGLLLEIVSDNREVDIRRGEADLAVRFRECTDPELVVRRMGSAGWSLYSAPSYVERRGPLTSPEDLGGHEVIGFDATLAGVEGATWLKAHGRNANIVLRGNSLAAVLKGAEVGLGIAPLPCFVGDVTPSLLRLTDRLIGSREILLVVHPDLAKVARVRAAMDWLLEIFTRDAQRWSGLREQA